ncbi:50S ribosomal protein L23 [Mycoplasmopsis synoviae]|uniref:Large ribosomal subunit protein uL23 n=1 Tax=Mycoplasmopsis synoviae (strain 53) TaxID=262723 RepID=Q4A5C3_MYCS5|nr:50S ribosomal protein L23 [Mycoplasmopsis synoviae]AAZ44048.1 50S ribosomal protein L23 [Mycoplasmopsis synoviae 53]
MELTRVIQAPIITEKTDRLLLDRKYTFKVDYFANKHQIKQAVETIFKVEVVDVNTIKVGKKPKKLGRFAGFKSRYKKAIVTLAAGQRINYYPEDESDLKSKAQFSEEKAIAKEAQSKKSKEVSDRVAQKLANKKQTATKTNENKKAPQTTHRKVGSGS